MKKLFILFCFFGFGTSAFADLTESRDQFVKGNMLYEQGKFEEAITHFEKAAEHAESAELYYNLGNAYFKTNQIPQAILNYERALKLTPNDTDLQYNLKLANTLIKDKIEKLPELNLTQWWRGLTLSIPVDIWAWGAVGLMAGAVLLLIIFFVSGIRAIRMLTFYTGILLIILSIVSYNRADAAQSLIQATTEAIIFSPKVDVKSSPTDDGINVFILHEGSKVRILKESGEWYNIRIASGSEGWIHQSNLERI
jgi:tetratricopeptide (TPR) repeat protein